jgi:hypothetical protein
LPRICIQHSPQRGDLDGQVVGLDRDIGPDGIHDLALRDNLAAAIHQQAKDPKRAGADLNRSLAAAGVQPKQPLPLVEQEVVEPTDARFGNVRHCLLP